MIRAADDDDDLLVRRGTCGRNRTNGALRVALGGVAWTIAAMTASCSTTGTTPATSTADAATTSRSPCSTGPAWDASAEFPSAGLPDPDAGDLPTCIPRCGSDAEPSALYSYDALPSGSCSVDHEQCRLTIYVPCPCLGGVKANSPERGMRCECVDGTWGCAVEVATLGVCACEDASADADSADGGDSGQ